MQNLNFDDGSISLAVQGDMNRLLTFNPTDLNMASKFYKLIEKSEEKGKEITEKAKKVDNSTDNKELIEFLTEVDEYFKGELDNVFGAGSSKIIFGDINVMSTSSNGDYVISNFLMALCPHFEKAQKDRVKHVVESIKNKQPKKLKK